MAHHARGVIAAAAAAAVAAGLSACSGSARRSEPIAGPLVITEAAQDRGRLVFMQNCYKCHPGGEAGLGPSLNDKRLAFTLPPRRHVRRALDSGQFQDLKAYLTALRVHSERVHEPFEAKEEGL